MSRTNEEAGHSGEFERGRALWRRCQSADAPMDEAARFLDLAAFAEGLLDEEEHDRVAADLAADPVATADVAAALALGAASPPCRPKPGASSPGRAPSSPKRHPSRGLYCRSTRCRRTAASCRVWPSGAVLPRQSSWRVGSASPWAAAHRSTSVSPASRARSASTAFCRKCSTPRPAFCAISAKVSRRDCRPGGRRPRNPISSAEGAVGAVFGAQSVLRRRRPVDPHSRPAATDQP